MGSYTSLHIDHVEIDWMKNHHGFWNYLFTARDKKTAVYEYADNVRVRRPAYVKKLKDIKKILEMAGSIWVSEEPIPLFTNRGRQIEDAVSKELADRLSKVAVKEIKENENYGLGSKNSPRYIYPDARINEIIQDLNVDLSRLLMWPDFLYILLKNPANENCKVIWQYQDLVDGGWYTEDEIENLLGQDQAKYLIITEGSSDTFVIQKALSLIEPSLFPYFKFIDMTDNYPFTGTGNLFRFCQGLAKIGIQNLILIIFDNDVEGRNRFEETKKLKLPSNIKPVVLPDLKTGANFLTVGPNGEFKTDVNGKGVSIEMFLDLNFKQTRKPRIRWTGYEASSKMYQGSLEDKEDYVRKFKEVKSLDSEYDFRKLKLLVSWLINECKAIKPEGFRIG